MKGKHIQYTGNNLNGGIKEFVGSLLEKKYVNAVLAPRRIPSGESFAYELTNTEQSIEPLTPFPPVIPINGARVLKELTRKGSLTYTILCIMRPCEIRASVELAKLHQVDLENIVFLSLDCSGVMPTKEYITDPEKYDELYTSICTILPPEALRPACRTCVHFTHENVPTDLHIAILGQQDNTLTIIPCSEKGSQCMQAANLVCDIDTTSWHDKIKEHQDIRLEQQKKMFFDIAAKTNGITDLDQYFADCINCHNCMRVCPICYCRQCYFDSPDATRIAAEDYLSRAQSKGGITLPADKLLFHLGRMSHMALSCIGCGSCEDACAMDVPVAHILAYMAEKVQQLFNYLPGRNAEETIPIITYQVDEFHEYEDAKGSS